MVAIEAFNLAERSIVDSIFSSETHMVGSITQSRVFLCYAAADRQWADRMQERLESMQITVLCDKTGIKPGADWRSAIRNLVTQADIIFALIGPRTRRSRIVDEELEIAMSGTQGRRPPGLVAVVLPEHDDYAMPFYDPGNVPLRVDDYVSRESSVLRKWSEDPQEIKKWIADAEQCRQRVPVPFVSFGTAAKLRSFSWDPATDESQEQ